MKMTDLRYRQLLHSGTQLLIGDLRHQLYVSIKPVIKYSCRHLFGNISSLLLFSTHLATVSLYCGISLANSSLLDGESLPSLWSFIEHESINVWAITDKHESTVGVLLISNMKSGFLIKFTQNLNGKLRHKIHYFYPHKIALHVKSPPTYYSSTHVTPPDP